jgi:hypothetical protein
VTDAAEHGCKSRSSPPVAVAPRASWRSRAGGAQEVGEVVALAGFEFAQCDDRLIAGVDGDRRLIGAPDHPVDEALVDAAELLDVKLAVAEALVDGGAADLPAGEDQLVEDIVHGGVDGGAAMMSHPRFLFVIAVVLMMAVAPSLADDYYLSPDGIDENAGTRDAPWRTLARANVTLQPGDTGIFLPGEYIGAIAPANNGTSHAPIVYRAEEPRAARLIPETEDGAILLDGHEHIVIADFFVDGADRANWGTIADSQHITVSGCEMRAFGGGSFYNLVVDNSTHVRLLDNLFDRVNPRPVDMVNILHSSHVVFEGNSAARAGHNTLTINYSNYVVARSNVLHNEFGRNHTVRNGGRILFEANIMTRARDSAGSAGSVSQTAHEDSIIRYNRVFDNLGAPWFITNYVPSISPTGMQRRPFVNINNRWYNNVFADNLGYREGYALTVGALADEVRHGGLDGVGALVHAGANPILSLLGFRADVVDRLFPISVQLQAPTTRAAAYDTQQRCVPLGERAWTARAPLGPEILNCAPDIGIDDALLEMHTGTQLPLIVLDQTRMCELVHNLSNPPRLPREVAVAKRHCPIVEFSADIEDHTPAAQVLVEYPPDPIRLRVHTRNALERLARCAELLFGQPPPAEGQLPPRRIAGSAPLGLRARRPPAHLLDLGTGDTHLHSQDQLVLRVAEIMISIRHENPGAVRLQVPLDSHTHVRISTEAIDGVNDKSLYSSLQAAIDDPRVEAAPVPREEGPGAPSMFRICPGRRRSVRLAVPSQASTQSRTSVADADPPATVPFPPACWSTRARTPD